MYNTSDSVEIICQSLKDFSSPLDLDLTNLKEIHVNVADGWSCASLSDFNQDLKTKAPQLLKMKLVHFEDWDIYSLSVTLESLHLSADDNSLDLYDLNLEELKNIKDFSFKIGDVKYIGNTQAELVAAREKYHSASDSDSDSDSDADDIYNETLNNERNGQLSASSTAFFNREFENTFSSSEENMKENSTYDRCFKN